MSHREKTAWLSLIALAVTFGPYFAMVAVNPPAGALPNLRQLGLYATVAIAQLLILGAGHLYLRRASPEEARMPADERDRAISQRATTWAYYVLIAGMIVVGCIMPFTTGGWTLVNTALAMITASQVVHYGIAVLNYRRQA